MLSRSDFDDLMRAVPGRDVSPGAGDLRARTRLRAEQAVLSALCRVRRWVSSDGSAWWALGWLVPLLVQVAHTLVVAPVYHVGSFDDDANYLMAAHVLAAGGGLTTKMPSGVAVVANYLPGYPILLVPVIWLFGSALWAPRLVSGLCVAALYPLMWAWTARRGLEPGYRTAVLGLLAINTVLATYSTMVMAEAPFLVVLVLVLLALDRWERQPGPGQAAVVVLLLTCLVWLKEAGIGLAVGLVAFEAWRRRWLRSAGVAIGTGALLLPGLVARWATGGSAIGDRYVGEISNPAKGGLLRQVPREAYQDARSYLHNVLAQSVLPSSGPLPAHGPIALAVKVVGYSVPALVVVGAVAWYRRHPTSESWMLWAYFAETLAYPFTNQRRVVLVLPLVVVWYVSGARAVGRWALSLGRRAIGQVAVAVSVGAAVLVAGLPAAAGFGTDYLYRPGAQSSEWAGSPAMSLLAVTGPAAAVVETDYRGSVAFFSGHRTAWTAFTTTTPYGPFAPAGNGSCTVPFVSEALRHDQAKFLIVGDFNFPGLMDSPCLLRLASSTASAAGLGAVRLLSTTQGQASLFELVGPRSDQPGLVDRTAGVVPEGVAGDGPEGATSAVRLSPNGTGDAGGTAYKAPSGGGAASFLWSWATPVVVNQLSVGEISATSAVSVVNIEVESPAGLWRIVARAAGAVGDAGVVPYLVAELPVSTRAVALRVLVKTSGTAEVAYVNAIGPAS